MLVMALLLAHIGADRNRLPDGDRELDGKRPK
jgi:hypothetical protein